MSGVYRRLIGGISEVYRVQKIEKRAKKAGSYAG